MLGAPSSLPRRVSAAFSGVEAPSLCSRVLLIQSQIAP